MDNKKKLGLFACVITGIGAIIGSGIFGTLPTAINDIGSKTVLALVLATIFELAVMVPIMYASTVLPTRGGFYVMSSKLIHPWAGIGVFIDYMLEPVTVAMYAVLFSDYFCQLVPALADNELAVSLALLLVFGILAYCGNYFFASVNSVAVFALVVVIGLYIYMGLSGVDACDIDIEFALSNGIKLNSMAVVINLFTTCLMGASNLSQIADEIKNPRRNVPLAIVISTLLVSVVYILISIATLKYVGNNDIHDLSEVARKFMPSSLVTVFIICGPILGVLTTLTPVIMSRCSILHMVSKDKLLPQIFTKENTHGVPVFCLAYVMLIAFVMVISGSSFDMLISIVSALGTLINIPICIFPFEINRKYPNAAKHPGFNMNAKFVEIISAIVAVISTYLAVMTFKSLGIKVWGILLLYVLAILLYVVIRKKFLKAKGIDLMAELAEPLEEWAEREEACKKLEFK